MATVAQRQEPAIVPFFTDTRTLSEKLACDKREWRPHQPKHNCPAVVYGLVTERDTFTSAYGDGEKVPTLRILTADNIEWSVIGFHGYLRSELERKDPRPGDFIALAFTGTKPGKTGESDAYLYVLELERNPATPVTELTAVPDGPAAREPDEPAADERPSFDSDDGIPF